MTKVTKHQYLTHRNVHFRRLAQVKGVGLLESHRGAIAYQHQEMIYFSYQDIVYVLTETGYVFRLVRSNSSGLVSRAEFLNGFGVLLSSCALRFQDWLNFLLYSDTGVDDLTWGTG